MQTISTVPMGINRTGYSTAEVVVHPSGKFLYGSNRGFDTIAAFTVNPANGFLTSLGQFGKGLIKTPRNFNIDPTGTYLLAEGQDSDNIVVFKIDPQTGELTPTGEAVSVGRPVCIRFVKP
ncbi:MAG: beta-propeller fold lactonase family protein [Planctomycetales bacterium]